MWARLSKSSRGSDTVTFPMFVMKISDFLQFQSIPPHEDAKAAGALKEFSEGMEVAFISHCWLGRSEPDPTGVKFEALQSLFMKISEKRLKIPSYWVVELLGGARTFTEEELYDRLFNGYLWMDYFSIPQQDRVLQKAAIKSIYEYIQKSKWFMVCQPSGTHWTGKLSSFSLWGSRGWCRAEQVVSSLSPDPKPTIVIESGRTAFITPADWLQMSVGLGNFTENSDKAPLGEVLNQLLHDRLESARKKNDYETIRFLQCSAQFVLLDTPAGTEYVARLKTMSYDQWMESMFFKSALDGEESGWSPLRFAIYMNRLDIAKELVAKGASVQAPLAEPETFYFPQHPKGNTILNGICCLGSHPEAVSFLLHHRADPYNAQAFGQTPMHNACCPGANAEIVQILYDHEPNTLTCLDQSGCLPLHYAAASSSPDFFRRVHDLTINTSIGFQPALTSGVGQSVVGTALMLQSDSECLKAIIEIGYELNTQKSFAEFSETGQFLVGMFKQQIMDGTSTQCAELYSCFDNGTPLMIAALLGRGEAVKILLEAKADPTRVNSLGRTALHYASMAGHEGIMNDLVSRMPEDVINLADVLGNRAIDKAPDSLHDLKVNVFDLLHKGEGKVVAQFEGEKVLVQF